jgi:hypothetical protein
MARDTWGSWFITSKGFWKQQDTLVATLTDLESKGWNIHSVVPDFRNFGSYFILAFK